MPILLDPAREMLSINIFYTERVIPPHDISIFHFVHSEEEFNELKIKGYKTQEELQKFAPKDEKQLPGMVKETPDPAKIIHLLNTEWKRLNWKDQNIINSQALKVINNKDGSVATQWDWLRYRDLKLKTCLKRWSVTDDKGQSVPVSDENIDRLAPEVADELLKNYEKVAEPSEEDLKNL